MKDGNGMPLAQGPPNIVDFIYSHCNILCLMSSDVWFHDMLHYFLELLLRHFWTEMAIQSVSQDCIQIHVLSIRIQMEYLFYLVKSMAICC